MNEKIFYSEYFYQKGSKDTDVLEKNVKDHPYSSLSAFLLLYHYKKTGHPAFEKFAKKTALLFNNTHWLWFQLYNKEFQHPATKISPDEHLREEKEFQSKIENELPQEVSSMQNIIENTSKVKEDKNLPLQSHEIKSETAEIVTESIPEPLHEENIQLENENAVKEGEIIAFEPLHTVDYFASQGIKITEDLINNDKLGSQMKSFTAWLKSMKKLHSGKLEEQSVATEKLIQSSADESNINTEILTEAMAEVLIKQDKKEKAIEMFSKLSLINPSKSAYFAARIESIKSN